MKEFGPVVDANLEPPLDTLWAQRVRGWAELSQPAKRCYLECVLQDVVDDGPLGRREVEQLDSGCREYYFCMMLVWVRGSGMVAVRKAKRAVRKTIVDELEGRAAPRRVFYTWQNRYGVAK